MNDTFELITVNADNLDKQGFFCYMSKHKTPGYRQKHDWMAARLAYHYLQRKDFDKPAA